MASPQEASFGTLEPIGGGDPIPLLKERLVIGRREICDIRLPFANVSGQHCELVLEQGYWKVRDLHSQNGVKVNGERVEVEKRVYPNDELAIAKHRFRLDYTPTTARSADVEVDELHEDIMKFSLLERAGLTQRSDRERPPGRDAQRQRPKSDDDVALEFRGPEARPHQGGDDFVDPAKPGSKGPGVEGGEEDIESVTPATSAHDLSDEEFLRIVTDEQEKQKRQNKKPS